MAIIKTGESTPIGVGKFVHARSKLEYGVYSKGRKVTGFAGTQRILYEKDGKETFMLRKDVLLICDTQSEAESVLANSLQLHAEIKQAVDRVIESAGYEYDVRLNALIEKSRG